MVFGGQKRERHEPADILLGKTFERSLSICGKNFHPVANRLQAALYREVVYLIGQGVLRAADADDAVSWGPGLRWGIMGPSLLWRIGGDAGFHGTPYGPDGWLDENSRNPDITPDLKRTITEGVVQEAESFCRATREGRKRVVAWTS